MVHQYTHLPLYSTPMIELFVRLYGVAFFLFKSTPVTRPLHRRSKWIQALITLRLQGEQLNSFLQRFIETVSYFKLDK